MKRDKVPMKDRQFLVYWSLATGPVAGFHTLETAQRYAALLWDNFKWLTTMQIINQETGKVDWSKERTFKEVQ